MHNKEHFIEKIGHSKSTVSKNHKFTSLRAINDECKAVIQRLIQNVDVKTEACKTGVSLVEKHLAEVAAVKTKAVKQCDMLREECHSQIDQQFDDIKTEIQVLIQQSVSVYTEKLDQIQFNIQSLATHKGELEQSLQTETGGVIEADTAIGSTTRILTTINDPDINIHIPTITVEPSAEWTDVKAARLKTSPGVDTRRSDIAQVYNFILYS